jgi:hypothetical protein
MWEEAVVAKLGTVLSWHLSGWTEESHCNFIQHCRSSGRDLNPVSLQDDAGVLTTRSLPSGFVIKYIIKIFPVKE